MPVRRDAACLEVFLSFQRIGCCSSIVEIALQVEIKSGKLSIGKSVTVDENGHVLNYGASYNQLNALNIPVLHDMGLTGAGVVIGVLDQGYDIDGIACFENLRVASTWNFITGSENYPFRIW